MSFTKHREVLLKDPLSELTRNKRKYLLISSAVAIAIGKAGFIPTEISALGIELHQAEQNYLELSVLFIVTYFIIAFFIYALTDFLAWINDIHETKKQLIRDKYEQQESFEELMESLKKESMTDTRDNIMREHSIREQQTGLASDRLSKILLLSFSPTALIRGFLDFAVPIAIGIYAIY